MSVNPREISNLNRRRLGRILLGTEPREEDRIGAKQNVLAAEFKRIENELSRFLSKLATIVEEREVHFEKPIELLFKENIELYSELDSERYKTSLANPDQAVKTFGNEIGPIMSALYSMCLGHISEAFKGNTARIKDLQELVSKVSELSILSESEGAKELKNRIIDFKMKHCESEQHEKIRNRFGRGSDHFTRIVMESEAGDSRFAFRYGLPISSNDLKMIEYIDTLPEDFIDNIARNYVESFLDEFKRKNRNMTQNPHVLIEYFVGDERFVKQIIKEFNSRGVTAAIRDVKPSSKFQQYNQDHIGDISIHWNEEYKNLSIAKVKEAIEENKRDLSRFCGLVVLDRIGIEVATPANKDTCIKLNDNFHKLAGEYSGEANPLLFSYVNLGNVISFYRSHPGYNLTSRRECDNYEELFNSILSLYTMDDIMFQKSNESLIRILEQADYIMVEGKNGNNTRLSVKIQMPEEPQCQTSFYNSTKGSNPAGEVYTSPSLKGTNGVYHVNAFYHNGLEFKDLMFVIEEGRIIDYFCYKPDTNDSGRRYIKENLFNGLESVPIGEFAVGTNTLAYILMKKFGLEKDLTIEVKEKTGVHIAAGIEPLAEVKDIKVCNPNERFNGEYDGKEFVSKANEMDEKEKRRFRSLHLDVTLPYDELGGLTVIRKDGSKVEVFDNIFLVDGMEEINKPLINR